MFNFSPTIVITTESVVVVLILLRVFHVLRSQSLLHPRGLCRTGYDHPSEALRPPHSSPEHLR